MCGPFFEPRGASFPWAGRVKAVHRDAAAEWRNHALASVAARSLESSMDGSQRIEFADTPRLRA